MVQRRKNKSSSRKRSYFGRTAKKTQALQKDLVKQAVLTEKDFRVAESVLEMLDNIEQDSKYDDDYSLGYQEGLKKAIRILRKHYSIKKTFQLR